jgi:IS4 transposase
MKDYPKMIRRIRYIDKETGKRLTFLTNNMLVSAETVALLYKNRWHVELFFKWIKQHLKVKRFFFFFFNALKSQIWIAVCIYVLIAIVKARFSLSQSYRNTTDFEYNSFRENPCFDAV